MGLVRLVLSAMVVCLLGSGAAASQPQGFARPGDGFAALAAAARAHDEQRLLRILGTEGRRLVRSGDPVADRAALDRFATAYEAAREIVEAAPDRQVLLVGADRWPLPIPMVRRGGTWRFDPRAGERELIGRRIGRNELDTIQTLRAIVDAQDDYARTAGRDGAFSAYARHFFSSPGTRDGLYWTTARGEPPSPLGSLVAAAGAAGYAAGSPDGAPRPLHGYLYRILEAQGDDAPGGAMRYVVNDRMIGGFGVIAWPARYGSTGVKTFIVSHSGVVHERDLGAETARLAPAITAYDPGPAWLRVGD
ncbi:MAG: DUF2950 domain-containing protein [Alphaproteobacteria bacterium]